jgi:hypothetical protein
VLDQFAERWIAADVRAGEAVEWRSRNVRSSI